MQTTNVASPAKLRDGTWGARADESITVGSLLTIQTRAGKTWTATVSAIVWTGNGVAICRTASAASTRPSASRRGTWTGCSCGSVEEFEKSSDCSSCRFDR